MGEKKFIDGMRFNEPPVKAPKWIKGQISVNVPKFRAYMDANQDDRGWLNIDVKEAKSGVLYLELNTYRQKREPPVREEGVDSNVEIGEF